MSTAESYAQLADFPKAPLYILDKGKSSSACSCQGGAFLIMPYIAKVGHIQDSPYNRFLPFFRNATFSTKKKKSQYIKNISLF